MSPSRQHDRQTVEVSSLALHLTFERGRIQVVTGQTATFSRAVAGGTGTDSEGNTVPAWVRDDPVFTAYDLDGDGERERIAIQLTSDDSLAVGFAPPPGALGFYADFIAGTDLLSISIGAGVAPYLTLEAFASGDYQIEHDNNVDAPVNVQETTSPTVGQRVQLWAPLAANGAVSLWRRYASGVWTLVGTSSAPAAGLAASFSSQTVDVSTDGTDDVFAVKIDYGPNQDQTTIEDVR